MIPLSCLWCVAVVVFREGARGESEITWQLEIHGLQTIWTWPLSHTYRCINKPSVSCRKLQTSSRPQRWFLGNIRSPVPVGRSDHLQNSNSSALFQSVLDLHLWFNFRPSVFTRVKLMHDQKHPVKISPNSNCVLNHIRPEKKNLVRTFWKWVVIVLWVNASYSFETEWKGSGQNAIVFRENAKVLKANKNNSSQNVLKVNEKLL